MRYRSNNILALLTPNKEEQPFLDQILFFRQSLNMRVFFYHIIEKPSFLKKFFQSKQSKNVKNEELKALHDFVEKQTPREDLQHMSYRVKTGSPLSVLIGQSKNGGYEFLMVKKGKPGSTLNRDETDKLISRACCPALVMNKNVPVKKIKKIVIPIDISQSTKKKLLWATYFAKKFGAKINIVSALSVNIDTKRSLVWRNAEKLKHMLIQRGISCNVDIIKTNGKEKHAVILDYIEKEKPDMVIIRTHQDSSLTGAQVGKFVSEVVNGCSMPVFTVNRFNHPMPVDFEL